MLDLGFERLESEPGCFVKKGASHKDTIIVVMHVDDLLSVGKRKHLDNFFLQLEKTLKLRMVTIQPCKNQKLSTDKMFNDTLMKAKQGKADNNTWVGKRINRQTDLSMKRSVENVMKVSSEN